MAIPTTPPYWDGGATVTTPSGDTAEAPTTSCSCACCTAACWAASWASSRALASAASRA